MSEQDESSAPTPDVPAEMHPSQTHLFLRFPGRRRPSRWPSRPLHPSPHPSPQR